MALRHVDHMTENMRKALCGKCIVTFTNAKTVKSEKKQTQLQKAGETEKCLKK